MRMGRENVSTQASEMKMRLINAATYLDFYDAAHFKWVEAASEEKAKKVLEMYGDDTFTKLLKKVEPYSFAG